MNEWYYNNDNKILVTNENGENIVRENIDNIEEILIVENEIEEIQTNIHVLCSSIFHLYKSKKAYNGFRIVPNIMIIITVLICLIGSNFSFFDALGSNTCRLFCSLFFVGGNIILPCITKTMNYALSSKDKQVKYLEKELITKEKELKNLKIKSNKKLTNTLHPVKINKSEYMKNLYINLNFIQDHIINRDILKLFKSYKPALNNHYSQEQLEFIEDNFELLKSIKVKSIKKKK